MDDLMNEAGPEGPTPLLLANPGYDRAASAFTLKDGSMVLFARSETDMERDTYCLFRLTGEFERANACWLDWGYDPPVASTAVPLPGNTGPATTSLEIGQRE